MIVAYCIRFGIINRPHRLHPVHKMRRLFLQMSHVAWSASLCVGHMDVLCKKTAELIEMPFGWLTLVGLRNHVLDGRGGGQDRTSPFAAARGVRSAMRPFAKSLWTLVSIVIIFYSVAAQ